MAVDAVVPTMLVSVKEVDGVVPTVVSIKISQ
jgi:hypothetical protein